MPDAFPDPATLIPVLDGLPAPWSLMALLLYLTFLLHLILMNTVVGVAVITLLAKLGAASGFTLKERAAAAHGGHTPDLLLPKGVAFVVNLGIPPFLFMQCIYGQYIYSSSILMGMWWLSVMLVVMLAYYGLYINMYRHGLSPAVRTTALAISVLLLLWNAFLFVNNMTLLQDPARWAAYAHNAAGTLLNIGDAQVPPRYLHVILSCLAVGGLALALPAATALRRLAREGGGPADAIPLLEKKKRALRWFFYATLAQFPVGAWFFMALPEAQRAVFMGGDALGTALFALSLILTALCLITAWRERAWCTVWGALLVIAMMAGMRTLLRASMLEPYYAPQMRELDFGPLALFLGALALSLISFFWLARVYMRHKAAPGETGLDFGTPEHAGGDAALMRDIVRMRKREALMVIELALTGKDDEERRNGAGDDGRNGGAVS